MSFNIPLSGLNAASADLNVTGNNIANSGTLGFKGSRAEFADVFATSQLGIARNAVGQGTQLANVRQQFTQGQFDFTENSLDLAINGTGFFRMEQGGEVSYTRAGAFELNRDGYITNSAGKRLTGYSANEDGVVGGNAGPLQINTGDVDPRATGELTLRANLQSTAEPPAEGPFDAGDPATYNESTSTTVYDSLGNPRLATVFFVKGEDDNSWHTFVDVDGEVFGGADGHEVTFDNNGRLTGGGDFQFQVPAANGAEEMDITLDMSRLTQFGTPFNVAQLGQDGYTAGQFAGLEVGDDGVIFGRYTNGQSQVLGQVALARFPNPEKLTQLGENAWAESFDSGGPILGSPGQSGLGSLEAGALEQSNVDITAQLVNMITAQRNFQANAKMISTQDQVTQEILNIR